MRTGAGGRCAAPRRPQTHRKEGQHVPDSTGGRPARGRRLSSSENPKLLKTFRPDSRAEASGEVVMAECADFVRFTSTLDSMAEV